MEKNISKDEEYIIGESQEVTFGEAESWFPKVLNFFPAFSNRNFRLYFFGQLISLAGTWLQVVAQGWLVLKLTNSAFLVGLVAALSTLPTLFLALFGGVIVDRIPKKNILFFTQTSAMLLALILGLLTVFGAINVFEISVLAFLLGVVSALDTPARQAFVAEIVERRDLASAISLSAGIFNGARVIGPSIAGFLIAVVGVGGAFLINAASYIAVIMALFAMKITVSVPKVHPHPILAIRQGLGYSFSKDVIKMLIIITAVVSVFGWSYTTILPVIAQNTFHTGAAGLGYLYAFAGLGSLAATIFVSVFSIRFPPSFFILAGNIIFCVSIILFTLSSSFWAGLLFLFFAGFGLLTTMPTINSTIQHSVSDEFRGRVMSIYTMALLGFFPIGNVEVGLVSEHLGTSFALRLGAVIVLAVTIFVYLKRHKISDFRQFN